MTVPTLSSPGASDVSLEAAAPPVGRVPKGRGRVGIWVLALLLVPTAVIEVRAALTRPFWYDEVATVAVVSLRSPSAIWNALADAVDVQPPFFYLLTSAANSLAGNEHLGHRLPGLVGFFCVPICLYLFVSRRVGVTGGLIAAVIPILSGFEPYATEARPYGFEVGCLAVALLCWQRLESSRWFGVPLAFALTAAVASHYFAVLALPAFWLGEAVRSVRTREWRWAAWTPLVVCLTPLAIALPLISAIQDFYGDTYWARNNRIALTVAYYRLTQFGETLTAGIMAAVFAILANRTFPVWRRAQALVRPEPDARIRPEECVAVLFLLLLPFVTSAALAFTQGGLVMRYVLPAVLGLAIGPAFVLAELGWKIRAAILVSLLINLAFASLVRGVSVFRGQSRSPVANSEGPLLEQMVAGLPSELPVVVSSGVDYLPLAYYSSPAIRARLLTVVDPSAALDEIDTDSVDREEPILSRHFPLDVRDFSAFRARHDRFLLFSSGNSFDWWPARLSRQGHSLTLRQTRGKHRLYEVQLSH